MKKLAYIFNRKPLVHHFCTEYPVQFNKIVPEWTKKLKKANKQENVEVTLKYILGHILKKDIRTLSDLKAIQLNEEEFTSFERLCECRIARVPIQYILGEWEFMNMKLKMSPTVFIPRPETENFVKFVLKDGIASKDDLKFLEIGSGTGAICISLLKNIPNSKAIALDRSKIATDLTRNNAKSQQVHDRLAVHCHTVKEGEFLPEVIEDSKFDLIVCNPPIVKSNDLANLPPEMRLYENLTALDGGPDGLSVAKIVCSMATAHLVPGGKLWMELDIGHPSLLKQYVQMRHGKSLRYIAGHRDSAKNERIVEFLKL